jgi:hypothetical protein
MHAEDSTLYSLNCLHASAPKYWVVVDLCDAKRLERRICESHRLPPPQQLCSRFVRHQSLWVPVEVLALWDICYTTLQQKVGELVIAAPGAYQQGWISGWNVAEAINYGDSRILVKVLAAAVATSAKLKYCYIKSFRYYSYRLTRMLRLLHNIKL